MLLRFLSHEIINSSVTMKSAVCQGQTAIHHAFALINFVYLLLLPISIIIMRKSSTEKHLKTPQKRSGMEKN
jgi:hypothetical protein